MPDLACDLFENAIWLSRFIELEKVSTVRSGNVSMTSADVKLFFFFPFSFFWRLSNSSDNFCVVVLKFGLTELLYPSRLILFSPFPNGNQILLATDFNLTGFSNAIG